MQPAKPSETFTLLAMTLGFVVVQLDVTVVNVAIKSIGASMGGKADTLQWIVNAYTLAFAALLLTAGALGDRIGAKRVFIAGFILFTIASVCCGLAPNIIFLIASRAVQGIGAAILVPCSLALLNHTYTDDEARTKAVGIWAAGASAALAGGPILGGLLISLLGWRSIFFINIPIGLTGILLAMKYTKETIKSPQRKVDVWGQLLAFMALAALATSIIEAGKAGWANPYILLGFALFIILSVAFYLTEKKVQDPMLPLSLFGNPTFSITTAIGLFINIAFYGLIFIISLYFQQLRNDTPLKTGLYFLPMMAAVLIANLSAGKLSKMAGAKKVILLGEILFLAGCVLLLPIKEKSDFIQIVFQLVALGFGLGLIVPAITTALLNAADKEKSGIASGVLNTSRQAGSVIGVALFGSLVRAKNQFVKGMHLSLLVSAFLFVLCLGLSFRMKKDDTPSEQK